MPVLPVGPRIIFAPYRISQIVDLPPLGYYATVIGGFLPLGFTGS